jgi:hypothetical protein
MVNALSDKTEVTNYYPTNGEILDTESDPIAEQMLAVQKNNAKCPGIRAYDRRICFAKQVNTLPIKPFLYNKDDDKKNNKVKKAGNANNGPVTFSFKVDDKAKSVVFKSSDGKHTYHFTQPKKAFFSVFDGIHDKKLTHKLCHFISLCLPLFKGNDVQKNQFIESCFNVCWVLSAEKVKMNLNHEKKMASFDVNMLIKLHYDIKGNWNTCLPEFAKRMFPFDNIVPNKARAHFQSLKNIQEEFYAYIIQLNKCLFENKTTKPQLEKYLKLAKLI